MAMPALLQGEVQAVPNLVFDQDAPALRAQFGPAVIRDVERRTLELLFGQRFPMPLKPSFVFRGRDPMTFTTYAVM
jgi:hypothetical protein